LYLSNVEGSVKVFKVDDGTVSPLFTIPLPKVAVVKRTKDLPSGLDLSSDGKRLYVALNLGNRVAEFDAADGKLLRSWDVGVAPFDVRVHGDKLYVSNWGGRRPDADSVTGPAGRGTLVRVDPRTHVAAEGSLSIIDLSKKDAVTELLTGKHASALALSPDGKYLCVACAASDFIDVLDIAKGEFTGRIFAKQTPADLFGAAPTALAFSPEGRFLYVCNASQNAVAVCEFKEGKGELEGLIPTGWYPGAIVFDRTRKQLCVANIKAVSTLQGPAETGATGLHAPYLMGSLSLIPLPKNRAALREHTNAVLRNYRAPLLATAFAKPRPDAKPRPVPERVGEPSVFKHVLYIIKENRTYDQVLGDMPEGDGDPRLCIFGEQVTPNLHKLCRDFLLLDNTYCSGIVSADGHNWSCSAITTDYLERQFGSWPRSYPDGSSENGSDALAWSPAGFIWDAALLKKKTIRSFGEFALPIRKWKNKKGTPTWSDIWGDWQKHGRGAMSEVQVGAFEMIPTLKPHLSKTFAGYDMHIPEMLRADAFLEELREWEKTGAMPELMIMSLPSDHTAGRSAGMPTPRAYLAEHDVALATIIEGVSKSRFWKDTVIVGIEDDPQNGWDHVSGYRTVAFVASAWSWKRGTVSTQYNQTSLLRTIELILGLPPMNQLDATATPMFDCFGDTPDFRPFVTVEPRWPLDELTPRAKAGLDPETRRDIEISAKLPFHKLDACPEDVLNRLLWRSVHGTARPYPEWALRGGGKDDD
jgi:DNA-binding beta-propeller fold protein YncE